MRKRVVFRRLTAAGIAGICIFAGAGCRQETEEAPIEITLMHGYGGTLESYQIMQEIYDEFSEQNPDIRLNSIAYINNQVAVEKANDMLAVGEMPDILSTNSLSYIIDNAVKTGMALDLMPYIEEDPEWKEQIHPSVFETWEDEQGHLYTIPDALEWAGYWYNADYLKAAGITDENGDVKIPRTWSEMIGTAEDIQDWINETGQDIAVFSLDKLQITEYLFPVRLAGDGEAGTASAQHPEDGIDKGAVERTVADLGILKSYSRDVDNIESARQQFCEGKTVFYFNGVWETEAVENSTFSQSFAYANYPSEDGHSISYMSSPSGYILAQQEDKRKEEACIRFLKYMLSDEVQKKIAFETDQVPCNPKVNNSVAAQSETLFGEAVRTVQAADQHIKALTSVWEREKLDVIDTCLIQALDDPQALGTMVGQLGAK